MEQSAFSIFALVVFIIAIVLLVIVLGLCLVIADRNRTIRRLTVSGAASGKTEDMITFHDTGGTVRLTVSPSSLYYIESDDNYIRVWYTDGKGVIKSRMIRCRLKAVEDMLQGTSLIRCNRKYIVNTDKVKVLSKKADGYFLDMDNGNIPTIDVTKTYQANVFSKFNLK